MTRKIFAAAAPQVPQDRRGFMAEAARLRSDGLAIADIATCLRLTPAAVAELLFEVDNGYPQFGTSFATLRRNARQEISDD